MESDWVTTSTLIRQLQDFADQDAWGAFARRFREPIVRYARRIGVQPSDAEDVAQETLLAFADVHRRGRFDPSRGRLSQWLFGIASRVIAKHRARGVAEAARQRRPDHSSFWNEVPGLSTTSEWDAEWENALLEQCLARARTEVREDTWRAFDLVVREGRSCAEAADLLSVPIKTVYNAKHRVLERIRNIREQLERADG